VKVKTLSVQQPDADLIASGEKTIEIRKWRTHYRGPLLIASSARPANQGPAGVALALVDLHAVEPMRRGDWRAACTDWYAPGLFSWHVRVLLAIDVPWPIKGRLGIYETDARSAALRAAIVAWGREHAPGRGRVSKS